MSSTEENKQLVRDYFKAFLAADENWWREHIAANFTRHDPGLPFEVVGPAGVKRLADTLLPAIPDMELPIADIIAEGEKVLARLRVRGTHKGELMGIPPTGKAITVTGMGMDRVRNGQIVESWANYDALGMLIQLGVVPAPAGAAA